MKTAVLMLLAAGAASAATVQFPAHLSGAQFLIWWRGGPELPAEQPPKVQRQAVYAQGYLDAVVDLTQGKEWCSPANMEPGERDDRAITALEQARVQGNGNAARALLAQYVARFPCR